MLPCISSLLFALHPIVVAQNQMKMAPCRLVHQLHHAVFQGMDGLVLLQLPIFKQNRNENLPKSILCVALLMLMQISSMFKVKPNVALSIYRNIKEWEKYL